jgi:cytochrome P450
VSLSQIDFTDLDNFANGFPHDLFAIHRRNAPVYWHEPTEHTPDGEGFWSVATHAESLAVLRDQDTYSSVTGGERRYGGTLLQDLPIAGQVLNMMDDPRHSQIRRRRELRLPAAGGRRTADADDLHSARGSGGRPALVVRGRRTGLRLPRLPQSLDRSVVG